MYERTPIDESTAEAVTTSLVMSVVHYFLTKESRFNRIKIMIVSTLKQTYRRAFPSDVYYVQKSDDSRFLLFALLIAVRCVLPRYENRDIHR